MTTTSPPAYFQQLCRDAADTDLRASITAANMRTEACRADYRLGLGPPWANVDGGELMRLSRGLLPLYDQYIDSLRYLIHRQSLCLWYYDLSGRRHPDYNPEHLQSDDKPSITNFILALRIAFDQGPDA